MRRGRPPPGRGADPRRDGRLRGRDHRGAGPAAPRPAAAGAVLDADASRNLYATSEFFDRPLPAEAVDALLERFAAGPPGGEIGFLPWGGGDHDVAPGATAFPHRRARYVVHHLAVTPEASAAARGWVRDLRDLLRPYGTGGVYANFADPGLADPDRAYYGDNAARLREVRRRYDPDGVFRTPRASSRPA